MKNENQIYSGKHKEEKSINIPNFTPREIVSELDKFIIGQSKAKKAVAIALRNRWRRQQVPSPLKEEITPKNIILMGNTGVGKTEIARRLAKLAKAPFVKIEASKFTEVGYVGRDVDSMIRDLVENSMQMVRLEENKKVKMEAEILAEEKILKLLLPDSNKESPGFETQSDKASSMNESKEKMRTLLRKGLLDDRTLEITPPKPSRGMPQMQILGASGLEDMESQIKDMMGQFMPGKNKKKKVTVPEAFELFVAEESEKLIDEDKVKKEGLIRAEQSGIIFLDEIDKIAKSSRSGPDVSREGVQRDILPIVEGSTVKTKYGLINTDHILFIAAGAFHVSKVSDLIPELQGRFPIRVKLNALKEEDLLKIIEEPKNSLTLQYKALMQAEGIELEFTHEGNKALAKIAAQANETQENIGARRLHTVFEALMSDLSFRAPETQEETIIVDNAFVQETIGKIIEKEDLSKYIL